MSGPATSLRKSHSGLGFGRLLALLELCWYCTDTEQSVCPQCASTALMLHECHLMPARYVPLQHQSRTSAVA